MPKIAYFDCFSGISGDMILGALLDLGLDINFLKKELGKLPLKDYRIEAKKIVKGGIAATKFKIVEPEKHARRHERNITDLNKIIDSSRLEKNLKNKIKKIFLRIAAAEAKVHNTTIDNVHFHEIGAIDTIIDVAGTVIGLNKLGITKIYSSKLNVGSGTVRFSHGVFPVPAPATAEMLKGVPIYHNTIKSELVTPTGAALITEFASSFGEMPDMAVEKIGYGAGTKELAAPNVLRLYIGESADGLHYDAINVIEAAIDDMNPQIYEYVIEKLLANKALDATVSSVRMKKKRNGVLLTVLARIEDTKKLSSIIFEETTTIGVRIYQCMRAKLRREMTTLKTKYGDIRLKISKEHNELKNITPEYEDCKKAAVRCNVSLKEIYREINRKL